MRGSNIKAEAGFNVAAVKRSPDSLSLGMGIDSIEIFPCCERRTRIYDMVSLEVVPRNTLARHLVRLARILVF